MMREDEGTASWNVDCQQEMEDEKVLAMMRVVDGALDDRGFGPSAWAAFRASGNGKQRGLLQWR
jgi:hypothetical protein